MSVISGQGQMVLTSLMYKLSESSKKYEYYHHDIDLLESI